MNNRALLCAAVVNAVQAACASSGIAPTSQFVEREAPINAGQLPALNIRRRADAGLSGGEFPGVLRQLSIAVDLYHSGETRFEVVDRCELAISEALARDVEPLDYVQRVELDTHWDLDDLAIPYAAARLQITIEYDQGEA